MRILIHDFAGHPFQVQLSRELARRGHDVEHVYCASLSTTPQASLARTDSDPSTFQSYGISIGELLSKDRLLVRWKQERRYGRLLAERVKLIAPDVVLSANTPLDAQATPLAECQRLGVPFVFWVQDLIGVATQRLLSGKSQFLSSVVGGYYLRLERRMLQESDAAVLITDAFEPVLKEWDVTTPRYVIENWAPMDALEPRDKVNTWSRHHNLDQRKVLLYSGTLGLKHNPALLLRIAERFKDQSDIDVVVVSEGSGADWLRKEKLDRNLENLQILGFQRFEDMSDVLASADILVAILEPEAGEFSVPSKVLSYLTAGRSLLLAVPKDNLAARIVAESGAGMVVDPNDEEGIVAAAEILLNDERKREAMGARARDYAERTFDIKSIADRFETVLAGV